MQVRQNDENPYKRINKSLKASLFITSLKERLSDPYMVYTQAEKALET